MFNLSMSYKNGVLVEKDLEKSFYYMKEAAEFGYQHAYYFLAQKYFSGERTSIDFNKAKYWLEKYLEFGTDDQDIVWSISQMMEEINKVIEEINKVIEE